MEREEFLKVILKEVGSAVLKKKNKSSTYSYDKGFLAESDLIAHETFKNGISKHFPEDFIFTEEDDIDRWDKVEERVNEVHKKSRRPKTFRKEELEDVVVKYHQMKEEDSSEFHDSSLILRLISSLKTIYDHCKSRYLKGIMSFRIYFQVNKNHYLNKEFESMT